MFSQILRTRALQLSSLVAALALSACGGGTSTAQPTEPELGLASFVARYGNDSPRQHVELFVKNTEVTPAGVMVWIHGGGWTSGDIASQWHLYEKLVNDGMAVLSVSYRLLPEGAYPNATNDAKAVLAAVEDGGCSSCTNPKLWQLVHGWANEKGWMVAGASTGGHMAAMSAMEHLSQARTTSTRLQCVNNSLGPLDLRPVEKFPDPTLAMTFNFAGGTLDSARLAQISPLYHLEQGHYRNFEQIKWYSTYSQNDALIPFSTVGQFEARLANAKVPVFQSVVSDPVDDSHSISRVNFERSVDRPARLCFGMPFEVSSQ